MRVTLSDVSGEGTGSDVFEAFQNARADFEKSGYRFLCYGASHKVWPSGMARDMGCGLNAYKLSEGRVPDQEALVDIFSSGDDFEPCTVSEQVEFADYRYRDTENRNRAKKDGFG